MNRRYTRKMPARASKKAHRPAPPLDTQSPALTAKEAQATQKALDQAWHEASQAAEAQWEYCRKHPYDTAAFAAYEKAVDAYWEAGRAADPEWYERVQPRRQEIAAAYPQGFAQAMEQLRAGDAGALEIPVRFLEADPWVFGSGYTKEQIIRLINRLELPPEYSQRLRRIVLSIIDEADGRREFRSYRRLARKVDAPEFRQALEKRLADPNYRVRLRAEWALNACRK